MTDSHGAPTNGGGSKTEDPSESTVAVGGESADAESSVVGETRPCYEPDSVIPQ